MGVNRCCSGRMRNSHIRHDLVQYKGVWEYPETRLLVWKLLALNDRRKETKQKVAELLVESLRCGFE